MATRAEKLVRRTERALEEEGIETHHGGGGKLGLLILCVGLVWLAITQGWIPKDWPTWPVVLIAAGVILLLTRSRHHAH